MFRKIKTSSFHVAVQVETQEHQQSQILSVQRHPVSACDGQGGNRWMSSLPPRATMLERHVVELQLGASW